MASSIQKVYIADGFVDDCEELIHRCLQSESLNFSTFCNHWKEMNFAYVFQHRSSGAEIAEFSEEAVHIAKRYMVANTSNYEESVAGLFLVYALLKLQPLPNFAPLRVTPPDLDAIYCLEDIARRHKRSDVLFILGKVLIEGPCHFHAGDRDYGMDKAVRKYCQVTTSIDSLGARPKGVFYRQNDELDLLRELSSLGRRYTRAKALIYGNKRPDKTLDYMDEHLPNEMAASLKQLIVGGNSNAPKAERDVIQSIKQKAMRDAVNSMRHLTGVNERQQRSDQTAASPKKKWKKKRRIGGYAPTKEANESLLTEDLANNRKRKSRKNEFTEDIQSNTAPVDTRLKEKTPKKSKPVTSTSDSTDSNAISKKITTLAVFKGGKRKNTPTKTNSTPKRTIVEKEKSLPLAKSDTESKNKTEVTKKIKKNKKRNTQMESDSNSDDDYSIASSAESNMTDQELEDIDSLPTIDAYLKMTKDLTVDTVPVFIRSVNEQNLEIEIVDPVTKRQITTPKKESDANNEEGTSVSKKSSQTKNTFAKKRKLVTKLDNLLM